MADLSPVEKLAIAATLAPAFSTYRGKAFNLPGDHEELTRRYSCDLVLRAEDGEIAQFEHTRPSGDVLRDRVRPIQGGRVHHLLQQCLNARGARGVAVYVGMDPPPAKPTEQEELAFCLCRFVLEKLRRERLSYFTFDVERDWDRRLRHVSQWLREIRIVPTSQESPAGVMSTISRMGHIVDTAGMFREALERKANRRYASAADLIVLVEFDLSPLDMLEVSEVREIAKATSHPFKEIWGMSNYGWQRQCVCLWPLQRPAETTRDTDR